MISQMKIETREEVAARVAEHEERLARRGAFSPPPELRPRPVAEPKPEPEPEPEPGEALTLEQRVEQLERRMERLERARAAGVMMGSLRYLEAVQNRRG